MARFCCSKAGHLAHHVCGEHDAKTNPYMPVYNPYPPIPYMACLSRCLLKATIVCASITIRGSMFLTPTTFGV